MIFDHGRPPMNAAQAGGPLLKARALMARYQRGDAAAVGELVTIFSPLLLRFFEIVGDGRGSAEELLERCWRRIHEVRHSWRPGAPVLPWMFAVARHVRADEERGRWFRRFWNDAPRRPAPLATVGAPVIEFRRRRSELDRLLAELPATQREAVFMLWFAGMNLTEIAGAMECTPMAAWRHADRGLNRLRRRLTGDCFGPAPEASPFFGDARLKPIQAARDIAPAPTSRPAYWRIWKPNN